MKKKDTELDYTTNNKSFEMKLETGYLVEKFG